MITIRIGRRGQITIPRAIRKQLNLHEGDTIVLIPNKEQAILRPVTETLLDLRGSVKVPGEQDFDQIRQQVIASRSTRTSDEN
jgi:AbrB family looped-hinge helix DNA binding protein